MKLFTIIKTGYTAGITGCTGEYFTLITINSKKKEPNNSFHFQGMYGAEERVRGVMQEKGFKYFYSNCNYGKLTRKDIMKATISEREMTELIKYIK